MLKRLKSTNLQLIWFLRDKETNYLQDIVNSVHSCKLYFGFIIDSYRTSSKVKMFLKMFYQHENEKVQEIANKVFEHNAEHVLARFVQYIFDKKLAVSLFINFLFL